MNIKGAKNETGKQWTEAERLKFEETQRQWREELCWQCARLQVDDFAPYCSEKCRRRAVLEMELKIERSHQDFEHRGDVSIMDNLKAEAEHLIQREGGGLTTNDQERVWVQETIAKRKHLVKTDSDISGPGTPPLAKREQLKLWAKFINHQYAASSALFELITGYKPPKMKEMAAIISGH